MICDKYAPNTLNGIIGNKEAINRLIEFAALVNSRKRTKPLILYGPSGVGKTAAAHSIAYSNGFELLELNSSDYRDVKNLSKILLPASRSAGLFNKTILILLDEIDELSKKFDSGAEKVIRELIQNSRHPIIFTATDYWDPRISFLRNMTDKIEFKKVSSNEILRYIKGVAQKEKVSVSEHILEEIAKRSNGDVRGALNDLDAMLGAKEELIENIGTRDSKLEVFGVLDKIFTTASFDVSRNAVSRSDVDIDMLINWVDENVTKRYTSKKEVYDAYSNVAMASRFHQKASRNNYYGYLKYASVLLSSGVALSNDGFVTLLKPYSFPANIRYMSATKQERKALNEIAERLSPLLHSNKKYIINNYIPLIKVILSNAEREFGNEKMLEIAEISFNLFQDDIDLIMSK